MQKLPSAPAAERLLPTQPRAGCLLQGLAMRDLLILSAVILCSGCAQLPPVAITDAPSEHTRAVVFDIDGTLTPHNLSVFEAREDAANAMRIFAAKGYKIIYLTARPRWAFQAGIPGWLARHRFPAGELHAPLSSADTDAPDVYKTRVLKQLEQHGWKVEFAFGDSTTHFEAYNNAGIPKEHVFALKRLGETRCQGGCFKACWDGWARHLSDIKSLVAAVPAN